jgi:predicted CXXCH cytochrome family protein
MATQKVHSPANDCLTCHRPHSGSQAHLADQVTGEMCAQCHDVADKAFVAGHLGIDPKRIECTSCHTPHASKDPKLFKKVVHAPFAGRSCDACHTAGAK